MAALGNNVIEQAEPKGDEQETSARPGEKRPGEDPQLEVVNHQISKKSEVVVIIAGSSRSGKSTALNNVFHTDFDDDYSNYSVTREVHMRRVIGESSDLIIVDTPGFGATDISVSKVKKEFLKAVGSLRFVLIYCYSVGPGNAQSKTDEVVAKNLQKVLGQGIWEKCVVFFTFSDQIRAQVCPTINKRDEYKQFISTHATRLSELLRNVCGSHVPEVKSVFDLDLDQENITEIVAVPVGLKTTKPKEKYELVPGINDVTWLTLAQTEVIRKAEKMEREAYLHHVHKLPSKVGVAAGAFFGGAIGAAGGGVLGAATLGLAIVPAVATGTAIGVTIGGIAGGAVGTTGGLTMGEVRYRLYAGINQRMIQEAPVMRPQLRNDTAQPVPKDAVQTSPIDIPPQEQNTSSKRPKGETPTPTNSKITPTHRELPSQYVKEESPEPLNLRD